MKAWARAAGKLARYEHIGWNEWPHSRCWSFHSGAIPIDGSVAGCSTARPRGSWETRGSGVVIDSSIGRSEGARSIPRVIRATSGSNGMDPGGPAAVG